MGTIIEAVATATADDGPASSSAVDLTDAAARACLERAGRRADDVQLLINAGVYLDHNISEPAIAALIQEDIGANLEIQPGAGQGTLSFDVRNGACGLLTGMYLIDGLLASGTVELRDGGGRRRRSGTWDLGRVRLSGGRGRDPARQRRLPSRPHRVQVRDVPAVRG